jgi:hypothetical protein
MTYTLPDDVQRNQLADQGAPLMCSHPGCDDERNDCCEYDEGESPVCCAKHDDGGCIDCQQQIDEANASRQVDANYDAWSAA